MGREEETGFRSCPGEQVWKSDLKCADSYKESKVEDDEIADKSAYSVVLVIDTSDEEYKAEEDDKSDDSVILISGISDVKHKVKENEASDESNDSMIQIIDTSDEECNRENGIKVESDDSVILISATPNLDGFFSRSADKGDENVVRSRVPKSKAQEEGSSQMKDEVERSKRRKRNAYDVDEDYNVDDEYYGEDDEKFIIDDLDSSDEEENEFLFSKRKVKRSRWHSVKETCSSNNQRRERYEKSNKRSKFSSGSNRRNRSKRSLTSGGKHWRMPALPMKSTRAFSDSDCGSSESSDCIYSTSDEGVQEHMKEANKIQLRASTRSSIQSLEKGVCNEPGIVSGLKDKEKVGNIESNTGKQQVCGICFTEEGRDTVRGTLNCCIHYFCFDCIMKWSKLESRCPLCKQRFSTITKPAGGSPPRRDVVIHVPDRDQVYQLSEEELINFIDPFDNMNCTECLEGGDDALMLLCDLCNSPAHTYCVGLGHQVPEGNWYCEGCRPTALETSYSYSNPTITNQDPIVADAPPSTTENMIQRDFMSEAHTHTMHLGYEGNLHCEGSRPNAPETTYSVIQDHAPGADYVSNEPSFTTENMAEMDLMSDIHTYSHCLRHDVSKGNMYCEGMQPNAPETTCSLTLGHAPGANSVSNEPSFTTENIAEMDFMSKSHTYSDNLEHGVPEDQLYCAGPRPAALGTRYSLSQDHIPGANSVSNEPSETHTYSPCLGPQVLRDNLYCEGSRPTAPENTWCLSQNQLSDANSVSREPSSTTEHMAEIDLNVSPIHEAPAAPLLGFMDLLRSLMNRADESPYLEHMSDIGTPDRSLFADGAETSGPRDNFSERTWNTPSSGSIV